MDITIIYIYYHQASQKHSVQSERWLTIVDGGTYRGYYMAARGYEFYLRVLQVSLTSERSDL